MNNFDYDLFVIGGGSGGVRAGRLAAELGAKVAIAEEYRVGGTCVIRGCVPKKLLVYGSRYAGAFADARNFGWSSDELRFDWPTLIGNVRREVDRLNGVYTRTLEKAGVELLLTLRYQQAGLRGTLAARPAAHEHHLVVEACHVRSPRLIRSRPHVVR